MKLLKRLKRLKKFIGIHNLIPLEIQFVNLQKQYHSIKVEIDEAIRSVIESASFIGGKPVSEFEEAFASLYGVKHCISVANGTDAIYIVLKMLGIGSGDEVITAANSWISSSETITQAGAKPVFVDIHPDYYSMDESLLENLITPQTKAIVPVHLHGQMCNMEVITGIAKKHGLHIIEDCAQSHFSEYQGVRAGLFGIAGTFSFYPGKNLGAYGDAGCIITNDDDLAIKCRMYARHGAIKKHQHQIEGINSRLDGIQAAVLKAKLPHILKWTESRSHNARLYDKGLAGIKEISVPVSRPDTKHTFHLYVIRTMKRDDLAEYLNEKGIQTAVHYPTALPNLEAYRYLGYYPSDYPVASAYQQQILSLPMYPELSETEIQYICDCIREFFS